MHPIVTKASNNVLVHIKINAIEILKVLMLKADVQLTVKNWVHQIYVVKKKKRERIKKGKLLSVSESLKRAQLQS